MTGEHLLQQAITIAAFVAAFCAILLMLGCASAHACPDDGSALAAVCNGGQGHEVTPN
jgi:hypothetical protein